MSTRYARRLGRPAGLVGYTRISRLPIVGWVDWDLYDEYGNLKDHGETHNLVTQIGDQYWGERAAGIASPPAQVTGMQLGTGTTAVAKTGAGAAIVTLVPSSLVAIDATWPTSALSSGARRIQWRATYGPGVATATNIAEVALVNQSTGTQTAAPASATIARALLSPVIASKAAGDTAVVTWNTDVSGS